MSHEFKVGDVWNYYNSNDIAFTVTAVYPDTNKIYIQWHNIFNQTPSSFNLETLYQALLDSGYRECHKNLILREFTEQLEEICNEEN